jgi:hypothetical protein
MSIEELDSKTPVKPPKVNKKMNPLTQSIGASRPDPFFLP